MTIDHNLLTDPELHEPKDITTAASGEVYVADGLGSGAWTAAALGDMTAAVYDPATIAEQLVGLTAAQTLTNKTFDAALNTLSNVAVSDLANGTDGELITWDAAGAPATVAVGSAGEVLTSNGVGAAPTFQAVPAGGVYTARYISPNQVLTPAGTLSLVHGLGSRPIDWYVILENTTAELGYAIGDRLQPANVRAGGNNQGVVVRPTTTTLEITYGAGVGGGNPIFTVLDATTGVSANITNANWQAIFVALV